VNIFGPGTSGLAFQRCHQSSGFAADKSAPALADVKVKIKAGSQDVFAKQPVLLCMVNGFGKVGHGQGVLVADIDVSFM
jgi:hypothetical protein